MRRTGRCLHAFLLLAALLLMATGAGAETLNLNLKFEAKHQSMWGPGAAAGPSTSRLVLIDPNVVRWDVKAPSDYPAYAPPGGIFTADTYLFGEKSFGIGARAKTSGKIGLSTTFHLEDPGSVDVTYPVKPEIIFPDKNSFRAGDTIAVKTSYTTDTTWELLTTSPQFSLALDGTLKFYGAANAKLCVFDCVSTASVLPDPFVDFNACSYLSCNASEEFNIFTVRPGDRFETPPILGQFTPWSGAIGVPDVHASRNAAEAGNRSYLDVNHRSLYADPSDKFLDVNLDVVGVVSDLAHLLPLEFNTDDFTGFPHAPDLHGASFHYNVLHGSLNTSLLAKQHFRFDPDLKVTMAFARPQEHWVVSGATTTPHVTSDSVEMKVGDTLYVKYAGGDKQPTPMTPTFRLDNSFHSETRFAIAGQFDLSALALGAHTPSVEIIPRLCTPGFCTPEVSAWGVTIIPEVCVPEICTPSASIPAINLPEVGPLYANTFDLFSMNAGPPLVDRSWQMEGFQALTATGFSLDPENPIIAVDKTMSSTVNLGAGKRRVNYAIALSNPGDVKLSDVHLKDDLAAAFAPSRGFAVERVIGCSLTPNPGYDGKIDTNILGADNSLEPGQTKRLFLTAIVQPQPDPSPYVNTSTTDGTSQLGTLVNASASASVLLGPAPIHDTNDYALYGDQFVKLTAIGDSFGNVGTNNALEVKNGVSGTLAGDLRAGRYLKVQGEILADYAFSNSIVDVVGGGRLRLTGSVHEFANIPTFAIPPVAFNPSTPLAGNVYVIDNSTKSLAPGYYDKVTVNSGATLNLATGDYFIRDLVVRASATVNMNMTSLTTADHLDVGAGARLAVTGSTRNTSINVAQPGAVNIGDGAEIGGILTAPRANVFFGNGSRLNGAAYAMSITMNNGSSFAFHRDCDRNLDSNCDGAPDCN